MRLAEARTLRPPAVTVVLIAAAVAVTDASNGRSPTWQPAWSDEFDALDESRWRRITSVEPTNNSLQAYLPEQVTVEDGVLVITATDEPFQQLAFRSGQVITTDEQLYGRWEVRAKMPTSQGMWPAIWLLPDVEKYRWPSGGEIDILENRGNQPLITSSAFHYGSSRPYVHDFLYAEQKTLRAGTPENYHESFHVYAVDWTKRYLRFYVDGVNHCTVYDEETDGFLSRNVEPMQLVINNAIGGTFLPDPDESSVWPQRMEIDWVRVYELGDEPGEATFTNGGFEADGGSLAGWSLFGTELAIVQSVQAANEAVLDGVASLKLYGTFGEGDRFSGLCQGITVEPGDAVTASASALVGSRDSIRGSDNRALMKIEFYDAFGSRYGDGMVGVTETVLADGGTNEDKWKEHKLEAEAPAGAVEARLVLLFDQPSKAAGSVHIDQVSFGVAD